MRVNRKRSIDVKEIIKSQKIKRISFKEIISNKKFINNEID